MCRFGHEKRGAACSSVFKQIMASIWCSCGEECRQSDCPRLNAVWIEDTSLDGGMIETFVGHRSAGAIATFIGMTRDNFGGRPVAKLHYEAYRAMAVKQMREICGEIRSKWDVCRIGMAHRLGDVPVSEASVRIAISSAHRAESLQAVAFAIDRLKATVAIFKREDYASGEASQWKRNLELSLTDS